MTSSTSKEQSMAGRRRLIVAGSLVALVAGATGCSDESLRTDPVAVVSGFTGGRSGTSQA